MVMKPTVVSACVVLSLVALSGCDESTPTFPIGDGGWQVVLEIGRIPNPVDEYPVFIEIEAQVINLTDGRRPSDGAILLFETSAGTYENGLNEIEIGMQDGVAGATLQVDQPGRYEVSAEYVEESTTVSTTIRVGFD
jgi:hypothetical protein